MIKTNEKMHVHHKGSWAEKIAHAWLLEKGYLVFESDVGPIDMVAYNTKTKEFLKIDVKYLPYRLPAPNRNKLCQSTRPKTPFQVEPNVKFITVDEKGNCKII